MNTDKKKRKFMVLLSAFIGVHRRPVIFGPATTSVSLDTPPRPGPLLAAPTERSPYRSRPSTGPASLHSTPRMPILGSTYATRRAPGRSPWDRLPVLLSAPLGPRHRK